MQGQTIGKKVIENEEKERCIAHLLTEPDWKSLFRRIRMGRRLVWRVMNMECRADGTELADYEEVIREELERYGEDDLMQYFDGRSPFRKDTKCSCYDRKTKTESHGCTKLELNGLLSQEELQEFTEYIIGQYSDGWGEGFEQRDIKVDGER